MPSSRIESLATGMVRPKSAALFFDKLWVHPALIKGFEDDELEEFRVPPEVCLTNPMAAGAYYDSWERQRIYMLRKSFREPLDISEQLQQLHKETWDIRNIFQIESVQHFEETQTPAWKDLGKKIPSLPDADDDENLKLYFSTVQRNKAIKFITDAYAQRGVSVTPIYLTSSEYDEVTVPEAEALEICLEHVPTIADANLSWDQVFEIRQDKQSIEKLRRLKVWFKLEMADKTPDQIRTHLEKALDDYKHALKKHGVKTTIGGITSILAFASSSTFLGLFTQNSVAVLSGGLAIASGVVAWLGKRWVSKEDLKRNEVAYIYDINRVVYR